MSHKDYFLTDRADHDFTNYCWSKNGFTNEEVERVDSLVDPGDFKDGVLRSKNDKLKELDRKTSYKVRKSKVIWIAHNDKSAWLYDKLLGFISTGNKGRWDFTLVGMTESIQYSHYDSNQSHYGYHLDLGNGPSARRKISVVVQLSDPSEYEGGELIFYIRNSETIVPRKKGAVIMFPSYFLHKVTPVTKGLRKSLVAWVSGPAWK